MKELTEVKFSRTPTQQFSLEKTESGFNINLIDFIKKESAFKTFQELFDLSQKGGIIFTGFEENKNEAELILLYCMQEEKNTKYELQITGLTEENEQFSAQLIEANQEIENLKSQIETKNTAITELTAFREAAKLITAETEPES